MNKIYSWIIRPFFFLIDPEKAHFLTLKIFGATLKVPLLNRFVRYMLKNGLPDVPIKVFDLNFKNPLGLAAGFDKNGEYIDLMAELGFGCIEVGTVTPKPQKGNDQPRLFRLKNDKALINRMGFNNLGVDVLAKNLKKRKNKIIIIGGNIGKNKLTPNDNAYEDYIICFNKLHKFVDYFVINVSSPNTPNLRALQEKDELHKILSSVQAINFSLTHSKPILVKISPDVTQDQLDNIIITANKNKIDGLVVANTTLDRSRLIVSDTELDSIGHGGLSGSPLYDKTNSWIKYIKANLDDSMSIIGVGGILSADQANEHITSGADLIQIYTGLIYNGPGFIKDILKRLKRKN